MEYAEAFQVIDTYSRNNLNCFVAEFFPDPKRRGFHLLCFRPTNAVEAAYDYACKYVRIADDDISLCAKQKALPVRLEPCLCRELDGFARHLKP